MKSSRLRRFLATLLPPTHAIKQPFRGIALSSADEQDNTFTITAISPEV